jgi:hypothetical protein
MTQKHLKPRKKSGLGKTQNVASEAVRIMALSQRGRISKTQQKKKKEEKKDVIPLFCVPDSKTPEITHNRKQTSGKTKKARRTTNGYETFRDYAEWGLHNR